MKKIFPILFIILFSCNISSETVDVKEIDLYEYKNLHFVDIFLNNKKCRLLVDTGASKSLLDISKADYYEFSSILIDKDKYFGLGGQKDIFIIYDYHVAPYHITFLGTDLSNVTEYLNDHNINIAGVLGIDFLESNHSKIDFSLNKIFLNQE